MFSLSLPSEKKNNLLHQDLERKPNIFILNGSVNSKHAHPLPPPGLCQTFVILFWKSCKCPMVGLNVHTKPQQWGLKIDMERKPNIFILNGSVNSKHAHPLPPPGLCQTFVILFWKSCKCPMVGLNVHTKPQQWGLKIDMERKPNIFILNGSVNSKHAHPPPLPAFVGHLSFCFGKAANAPWWG